MGKLLFNSEVAALAGSAYAALCVGPCRKREEDTACGIACSVASGLSGATKCAAAG
jgi:hypothetical protein